MRGGSVNVLAAAALASAFAATSPARVSAAADDLTSARDLYAAAAYEDALQVLNRLRGAQNRPEDARAIDQYRAFCLLALGRANDAEQAIEAVLAAEPSYRPTDSDVSPRIRSAFADVRRRMLPAIIQQKYVQAKAAFDRKEYATAAKEFSQVLVTLADPDLASDAARPPLSDVRQLAVGFEELSSKAAAPPPPPPAPVVQTAPAPPPPAAVAAPVPAPGHIYTADDRTVVPPSIVTQTLPSFRGVTPVERVGRIEVVIDETGAVESVVMTASVNSVYDKLAVAAARTWRYTPATVNGHAVKFRKIVQITVRPTT
jgi:TonB family protein